MSEADYLSKKIPNFVQHVEVATRSSINKRTHG